MTELSHLLQARFNYFLSCKIEHSILKQKPNVIPRTVCDQERDGQRTEAMIKEKR